jgi:hypothetical protein
MFAFEYLSGERRPIAIRENPLDTWNAAAVVNACLQLTAMYFCADMVAA